MSAQSWLSAGSREFPKCPSVADWNFVELLLIESLLGRVSKNFRLVELAFEDFHWIVRITLQEESSDDREEALDVVSDLTSYLHDFSRELFEPQYTRVKLDLLVSTDAIFSAIHANPRAVFRLRD